MILVPCDNPTRSEPDERHECNQWSQPVAHVFPSLAPIILLRGNEFETETRIAQIGAPLLILHGTADQRVAFSHAEALFEAAEVPKFLERYEGGTHEDLSLVGLGFVDGGTGFGRGRVGGVGWEREVGRVERGFGLGDGPVAALEDLVDVVGGDLVGKMADQTGLGGAEGRKAATPLGCWVASRGLSNSESSPGSWNDPSGCNGLAVGM